MPVIWLKPGQKSEILPTHRYECPVYKTSLRWGELKTTGHSSNFVLTVLLKMQDKHDSSHWVKRGAAMLTQLDY